MRLLFCFCIAAAIGGFQIVGAAPAGWLNVRDFGAKGDGKSNDRAALQSALDARRQNGGGTVLIPPGVYRSGTLRLSSDTTLYLDAGAVLQSIEDAAELVAAPRTDRRVLLLAEKASNVTIRGEGTIRGTGADDYGWRWGVPMTRKFRSGLLHFEACSGIRVEGVTLEASENFTLVLVKCRRVVIRAIEIRNNLHHENTDGIDIFNSQDVRISDSRIEAGDDAIVLKSSDQTPTERILVNNCTLETTCSGFKFGTGTRGAFREIYLSNTTIGHGEQGIAFFMKDGGTIEQVAFSNLSLRQAHQPTKYPTFEDAKRDPIVRPILADKAATFADYNVWLNIGVTPILIDVNKRRADTPFGQVRDISFDGVQIRGRMGILIQGRPESPVRNLRMRGIQFRVDQPGDYTERHVSPGGDQFYHDELDTLYARKPSYFTVAHTEGFELDGYRLELSQQELDGFDRSALNINASSRVRLRNISRSPERPGGRPAIVLTGVTGVVREEAK